MAKAVTMDRSRPKQQPSSGDRVHAYQKAVYADPVSWAKEALGISPWSKQVQILESIRDNDKVTCRSSNAVGKTYIAAVAAIWYLESHAPGYVVTTANTFKAIEKALWSEIPRILRQAPYNLGGDLLRTEWRRGDQWGAFGISPKEPEGFSGFRTPKGAFVIVDESSALEKKIMEAILGLTATAGSKILLIGNPLRPNGSFYETFRKPGWCPIHISALESPNVVEDREVIPGLATRAWVQERKEDWGEGSPAYQARVLGEFPKEGETTLIPLSWAEQSLERLNPEGGKVRVGFDIARMGGDRTALVKRDDYRILDVQGRSKQDLMKTVGWIIRYAEDHDIPRDQVYVDDAGLGGGVTDRLRELGWPVQDVDFGRSAKDSKRFANLRAECYWKMKDMLNPDQPMPLGFSVPGDNPALAKALAYECTLANYDYTSKGQIKIEPKEKIKERYGKSPDLADALALTFAPEKRTPRAIWI